MYCHLAHHMSQILVRESLGPIYHDASAVEIWWYYISSLFFSSPVDGCPFSLLLTVAVLILGSHCWRSLVPIRRSGVTGYLLRCPLRSSYLLPWLLQWWLGLFSWVSPVLCIPYVVIGRILDRNRCIAVCNESFCSFWMSYTAFIAAIALFFTYTLKASVVCSVMPKYLKQFATSTLPSFQVKFVICCRASTFPEDYLQGFIHIHF